MRANEKRVFRVVMCAGAAMGAEESIFEVIEACRRQVCSEGGFSAENEFNVTEEGSSIHVLAYGM